MAHHASTPQSIIDAPNYSPVAKVLQHGYSRSERRHGVYSPPNMTPEAKADAHTAALNAGRNIPATSSKVAKIRRGRKARFNR